MRSQAQAQAVADSSVLLSFAAIGQVDLLGAVFADVSVPPAVVDEMTAKDAPPNRMLAEAFVSGVAMKPVDLPASIMPMVARYEARLGRGESEAIALAGHWKRVVLLDDLAARRLAIHEGVAVVGSLGVLAACKAAGLILRVRPLAEEMRGASRFFGSALLRDFYRSQGEA